MPSFAEFVWLCILNQLDCDVFEASLESANLRVCGAVERKAGGLESFGLMPIGSCVFLSRSDARVVQFGCAHRASIGTSREAMCDRARRPGGL